MSATKRPDKRAIGRLAERNPELLNPLVAFFVMGWKKVFTTVPMHGVDQTGTTRLLPNYVAMLGVDECVSRLLDSPMERDGPNDTLSVWAIAVSQRGTP